MSQYNGSDGSSRQVAAWGSVRWNGLVSSTLQSIRILLIALDKYVKARGHI